MIKKYIRGNELRGDEVIKELEKLGGKNRAAHTGCDAENFYIINNKNENQIESVSSSYLKELIEQTFEEIQLTEKFIQQKITIVTEERTNGCFGCLFENVNCSVCKIFNIAFGIDCGEKGIIYKKIPFSCDIIKSIFY